MKDKMIEQLEELEKGCWKHIPKKQRIVINSLVCDKYQLCKECKAKIQQLKSDIKIRIEELGEMIEFLEMLHVHENLGNPDIFNKIKELKQKKEELEESLK